MKRTEAVVPYTTHWRCEGARLCLARHRHPRQPLGRGLVRGHDRTVAGLQDRLPGGDRVRQRLCRCRAPARARRDDGQDRLCGLSAPLCRGGTLMRTILVTGGAGFIGSAVRSEEHTSELQSLMRISYAVFCLKKKIRTTT